MAGRSILYLGDSEFAAGFCTKLEAYACCGELFRRQKLKVPDDLTGAVDLVMFEPPSKSEHPDLSLRTLVQSLGRLPAVAVTTRSTEHRGISAVRSGAQGYVCVDDAGHQEIESVIDHAVQRHRPTRSVAQCDHSGCRVRRQADEQIAPPE